MIDLRPGLAYDEAADRLIVDGVPFATIFLADFVASLRPGHRIGPVFLERRGDTIIFTRVDIVDVTMLPRSDRTVWQ